MGEMRIMCSIGDKKVEWDPQDDKSINNARKKFKDYLKKGYKIYRTDSSGKKRGWFVKEFPPHAGILVLIPPLVGG